MRCRKHLHKSREAAEAQIRALAKRELLREGSHPYWCWRCRAWHVGRRSLKQVMYEAS